MNDSILKAASSPPREFDAAQAEQDLKATGFKPCQGCFTEEDKGAINFAHVLMTFHMDQNRQMAKNATNDEDRQRILTDGLEQWRAWLRVSGKILDN